MVRRLLAGSGALPVTKSPGCAVILEFALHTRTEAIDSTPQTFTGAFKFV